MACNRVDPGISSYQCGNERPRSFVLRRRERLPIGAFEFDAHGEIVAALPPFPPGEAGMPGTALRRNEFDRFAVAPDEVVCRHAQPLERCKGGMSGRIEGVGEEPLDRIAAEDFRRQADRVQYHQANHRPRRTIVAVG